MRPAVEAGTNYVNFRQSPEALKRMSLADLTLLAETLQPNGASSSSGRKQYRQRLGAVTSEIARREKLTRRQGLDTKASGSISPVNQYEILDAVLDPDKIAAPVTGIILEAHNDDLSMVRLTRKLSDNGVGLTVVTLTDGTARGLSGYKPDELARQRWNESLSAGDMAGVGRVTRIGLPDGLLAEEQHQEQGQQFLRDIVEEIHPDFIIAPNPIDEHPDHAAAHDIALAAVGEEIPVYGMDTIKGVDKNGIPLLPDRYFPLTAHEARREWQIYLEYRSQNTNLPVPQMRDVYAVREMTIRRGAEMRRRTGLRNVRHATVLFDPLNSSEDPLGKVLEAA